MKQFFKTSYSWNSAYFHFQKWYKNGSWQELWQRLLLKFKSVLDLSTIQLDGTHTPVKRGEKQLNTKAERNAKQLICLFLLTTNGIPIAFNEPIAGNHNDSFELVANFEKHDKYTKKKQYTS